MRCSARWVVRQGSWTCARPKNSGARSWLPTTFLRSRPWAKAANEDGTFKNADELKALYEGEGITGDREIIAYCRIGERSSHTWFALQELLGYPNVKNYDGSWTEYGSLVGAPVEKG
jgi:thiosulfate/3-mercaptopyruvate sulfurtransferase